LVAGLLASKTPASACFISWDGDFKIPADVDIVLNATSIRLFPDVAARVSIDLATLRSG